MAAHGSQVPRAAVRRLGFAAAYGREWYRRGPRPGLLDEVAAGTASIGGALAG
jgi:hypothetical protein